MGIPCLFTIPTARVPLQGFHSQSSKKATRWIRSAQQGASVLYNIALCNLVINHRNCLSFLKIASLVCRICKYSYHISSRHQHWYFLALMMLVSFFILFCLTTFLQPFRLRSSE
jgi:hypothetical protein